MSKMVLSLVFLLISGCAISSEERIAATKEDLPIITIKESWQQVTVKYLDFEGGFYGLVSENGVKLLPMDLPEKYKVAGTILRVKGIFIADMMTIQQWGKAFKIAEIELIKMGTGSKLLY